MLFALLFLFFALLINFVSLFVCFPQYFHLVFVNFFIFQPVFGNFHRQIAGGRGLQLDSASLHLAHGLRPPQFKTSGSSLAARFRFASSRSRAAPASVQDVRLKPCSSIPLRFISLTGCALYKKKGEALCSCEHDRWLLLFSCAWLEPRMQI